jgi:hypothetical protein
MHAMGGSCRLLGQTISYYRMAEKQLLLALLRPVGSEHVEQ